MSKLCICVCYLFVIMTSIMSDNSIIHTTTGALFGKVNTEETLTYTSYLSIPYGEPPIGHLRFKPPVPKSPWDEILDATKQGPVCPQVEGRYQKEQMSEDCLRLNIYVPHNTTKPIPVLVFIHGGEFKSLSGYPDIIYGPQLFLQTGIMFITVNYRLSALGFLSFETEEASGNAGLKDVLLALKWIKMNVEKFGGDSNRITLGGNSSGAALVHYLMLSKNSKDLFHQTLLVSGSALSYRNLAKHAKDNAISLCKQLGLTETNIEKLLDKLRTINMFDIIEAEKAMATNDNRGGFRPFAPFVPCVEPDSPHAILINDPIDVIKSGIPQNVPTVVGFNSDEGIKMLPPILKNHRLLDKLNEDFQLCIPSNIEYPYDSWASVNLASSLKRFYFNNHNISDATISNFVNLITDTQFSFATDLWIKLHKERENSNNVFYYVFDFDGDLNWFKLINGLEYPGAAHADDLGYMFCTQLTKSKQTDVNLAQRNRDVIENTMTYFSNFIRQGIIKYNDDIYNEGLLQTENSLLELNDKTLRDFGLPSPIRSHNNASDVILTRSYDNNELLVFINENVPKLVSNQRKAFDAIIDSLLNNRGKIFFVDVPGGTGKTYLANLVLTKVRQSGKHALAVASSGIAAALLSDGKTTHSTFKLPLTVTLEQQQPGISKGITWPECGMNRTHLRLNAQPVVVEGAPRSETHRLWYEVYEKYNDYIAAGGVLENKNVP